MKAFLKQISIFTIFFIGVYSLYLLFTVLIPKAFFLTPNLKNSRGGYAHSLEREMELNQIEDRDILLIGSSHAYRGFDPRILFPSDNSFNIGNSMQTPYTSYHLLKDYLNSHNYPRKVVFEIFWEPLSTSKSSVESSIDIISNKKITSSDLIMIYKQKNILSFNSFNHAFLKQMLNPIDTSDIQPFPNDEYISGGYVSKLSNEGYLERSHHLQFPKKSVSFSDYQMNYLIKCIELCKAKNIEFLAIRAPVMPELIASITNFNDISNTTDSLFKVYDVAYQDFCQIELINEMKLRTHEDFFDSHHMTQTGVSKFNQFWLENDKLGVFPKH